MARMHYRKKGKSGSRKPLVKKAEWVKYKPAEIEGIVTKLAGKDMHPAHIGIILRDQYGIPSTHATVNKKITAIMKEKNLSTALPDDLFNLLKKAVNLRAHMEKNKKDYTSQRGLEETESKIRRLAKYYKRAGTLSTDWSYDPGRAKLLVK